MKRSAIISTIVFILTLLLAINAYGQNTVHLESDKVTLDATGDFSPSKLSLWIPARTSSVLTINGTEIVITYDGEYIMTIANQSSTRYRNLALLRRALNTVLKPLIIES